MTTDVIADSNGIPVIARSVATKQSSDVHHPGLLHSVRNDAAAASQRRGGTVRHPSKNQNGQKNQSSDIIAIPMRRGYISGLRLADDAEGVEFS
jgi:hypothetical protein